MKNVLIRIILLLRFLESNIFYKLLTTFECFEFQSTKLIIMS